MRLSKETGLKPYVVEAPDVLTIDVVKLESKAETSVQTEKISGEHLVRPDGTIQLGQYGTVAVSGLTLTEAQTAIEKQLAHSFKEAQISLDVFTFNSKFYYVIIEASGEETGRITRIPCTGNETVLDALSITANLKQLAGKQISVARPSKNTKDADKVLSVDLSDVLATNKLATNHKLFPGDRLVVSAQSDRSKGAEPPAK